MTRTVILDAEKKCSIIRNSDDPQGACWPDTDPETFFNGGGVLYEPVFKIRTVDKSRGSSGDIIIPYVKNKKADGSLISANVGQEGSDGVTQKVLIGGPASRYYPAEVNSTTAFPVWGIKQNNPGNDMSRYVIGQDNVQQSYSFLDTQVEIFRESGIIGGASTVYTATLFELRMALGGMEAWETFKVFQTIASDLQLSIEPNGFTTDGRNNTPGNAMDRQGTWKQIYI